MKDAHKITSSDRKLFLISGIALAFIVAFGAWWQWVNAVPDVEIPTPKLPSPNAFTTYAAAVKLLVNPRRIYEVYGDGVPTSQKPRGQTDKETGPGGIYYRAATPAERAAIVRANIPALNVLRTGLKQQYREPPVRSFSTSVRHYSDYQRLAYLLILQGQVVAERGENERAAKCFLEAMQFGAHISKDASAATLALSYADGFVYHGKKEFWKILQRLNPDEIQMALRSLENIDAMQPQFSDVLEETKWMNQAGLLEVFENRRWAELLASTTGGGCAASGEWRDVARVWFAGKGTFMREYSRFMDRAIIEAKRPASLRRDLSDETLLTCGLQPNLKELYFREMRGQTHLALLRVALALRAYQAEHEEFPNSLDSLKPHYLRNLPGDSFNAEQPLQYRRIQSEYRLYSIGPDRIDNEGRAIEKRVDGKGYFGVSMYSKGDMVAGIN